VFTNLQKNKLIQYTTTYMKELFNQRMTCTFTYKIYQRIRYYNLTKYVQYVQEKEDLSIHHIIIHTRSSTNYFINKIMKIKHNYYEGKKTIYTPCYQTPQVLLDVAKGLIVRIFLRILSLFGFYQSLLLLFPNNCRVLKIVRQRGPP
jgi:hypothetical protein